MKTILSLRKHPYLNRVSIFLIVIALIAAMIGCGGDGAGAEYDLTMAVYPVGSGTATDLTGASPYAAGTVVNIQATAASGYTFVTWIALAGTFGSATTATTTFTMPAQDVTVIAYFVGPLDHFKGYAMDEETAPYIGKEVYLEDQFGAVNAMVEDAVLFFNPAEKEHGENVTSIWNPTHHLTVYYIDYEEDYVMRSVQVKNQFGTQNLSVSGPIGLVVPTHKVESGDQEPPCVDFEDPTLGTEYNVGDTFNDSGAVIEVKQFQWSNLVWTSDGFACVENGGLAGGSGQEMCVNNVNLDFDFGGPLASLSLLYGEYGGNLNIDINGAFKNFEDFIDIDGDTIGGVNIIVNDFGDSGNCKGILTCSGVINTFAIGGQELWIDDVCPTVPPPVGLNHFLLYEVMAPMVIEEYVELTDQFDAAPQEALVVCPVLFANPVQKTVGDEVTEIWDTKAHVVFYDLEIDATTSCTQVQVNNQFGAQQSLNLSTPAELLAVPSEKTVPPVPTLDHFKCYSAGGLPLEDVYVKLEDQFGYYPDVPVMYADGFCNPVKKVHGTVTTPISNSNNHLMLYTIDPFYAQTWDVIVDNQFGTAQQLRVTGPVMLATPTQKEPHGLPEYLDHYLLYEVIVGSSVDKTVDLDDQFDGSAPNVSVTKPVYFANPTVKGHLDHVTAPWNPKGHLVFYEISENPEDPPVNVLVNNQFEEDLLLPLDGVFEYLAVPSVKVSYALYEE